jgi:ABC-type antimicrobial peptide transport system permease subunit
MLASLVFAGVMGLFGGMLPAARAARINILEALRG